MDAILKRLEALEAKVASVEKDNKQLKKENKRLRKSIQKSTLVKAKKPTTNKNLQKVYEKFVDKKKNTTIVVYKTKEGDQYLFNQDAVRKLFTIIYREVKDLNKDVTVWANGKMEVESADETVGIIPCTPLSINIDKDDDAKATLENLSKQFYNAQFDKVDDPDYNKFNTITAVNFLRLRVQTF